MSDAPLLAGNAPLPRLPRFGLRTLLLAMALISGLFAAMDLIGPIWSLMLLWALLLIAAHVLGNAWGSQAFHSRGSQHEICFAQRYSNAEELAVQIQRASSSDIVLRQTIPGGRARVVISTVGAIVLGTAGGTFLTIFFRDRASLGGIAVWYGSCSVIGGLAGFVAGGLLQVFSIAAAIDRGPRPI